MIYLRNLLPLVMILCIISCDDDDFNSAPVQFARISIEDAQANEENETGLIETRVTLSWAYDEAVRVRFSTETASTDLAEAETDYTPITAQEIVFEAGETEKTIQIPIVNDPFNESNETFSVVLSGPENGKILRGRATMTILDTDVAINIDDRGYVTPDTRPGLTLVWQDEFDGTAIDESAWNFEIGTGNNGWGNNELQYYTDRRTNSYLAGGDYLLIEARQQSESGSDYTSARMTTEGKREFQYGRIDIRAKSPEGQGIWPALWMLGADFSSEGWPACGEIDIMEILGHQTQILYGTAHFPGTNGPSSNGKSTFVSASKRFSDEFHVFSINWQENRIQWLLDDVVFHEITPATYGGSEWPFNDSFFFIMNVAVGGNWPGSPNATTQFPQRMIVDYIRVFQ